MRERSVVCQNRPGCVFSFIISILLCHLLVPDVACADAPETSIGASASFWQALAEGFDYTVNILGAGHYSKPAVSSQNPDNDFLKIRQYRAEIELRPDFYLTYGRWELMAKPRASLGWEKRDKDNTPDETAWVDETGFNEYRIRYAISDPLFITFGRENLQWGPTVLYSPSNPFFVNTGRASSQTEIAGKGFLRLVYVPDMAWTFSLIANLDEGPYTLKPGEFEEIYALKADYNGSMGYAGMILSHQKDDNNRLGLFGVCTAIDNTLLYFEGGLSKENKVLYPSLISRHPMGGEMAPLKQRDDTYDSTLIVGASYTFKHMTILSLEYFYNGSGYSDRTAEDYYAIRRSAAHHYHATPYAGLARKTLGATVETRMPYLRQNYLFLQISRNNIKEVLDLRFILACNLDDNSNRSILNIGYNLDDHTEIFLNGISYHGGGETEYGSMFDHKVSIGFKYTI